MTNGIPHESPPVPSPPITREFLIQLLKALSYWFVPVVGLIYACGFLIVFTFFKTFGINGTEFFKAEYIHIGSLFSMGCIICVLLIGWLTLTAGLIRQNKERPLEVIGHFAGVGAFGVMLLFFYVIVAFAPRGFYEAHPRIIACIFVVPLLFMLTDPFAEKIIQKERQRTII